MQVFDGQGHAIARAPLTYRWDPLLEQYGTNLSVPPGTYTVRVDVDPPPFRRHDPINGDRFAEPAFAEFSNVAFDAAAPATEPEAPNAETNALAVAQGTALRRAFLAMTTDTAVDGASVRIGDVVLAYAVEFAEPYWVRDGDALVYFHRPEESAETNAHVEVAVLDAQSGRFLPELSVTATLIDADGNTVGTHAQPFMWHPWLHHYGENWRIPGAGRYRLRVHVDPPKWPRMDRALGNRFATPIDFEFSDVKLLTGQK